MAFSFKRSITIPAGSVSAELTGFPLVIQLEDDGLLSVSNGGHVQSDDGFDIAPFSDSALTTPLAWQIETYRNNFGILRIWVKIPTLSHTTDTAIWLAYGDASITTDQSDKTAVWDSSFAGVYHFASADGINVDATDSTSNGRDGTVTGSLSVDAGPANDSGSNACAFFDASGSPQYIEIPGTMGSPSSVTIELWSEGTLSTDTSYNPTLVSITGGPSIMLQHLSGNAFTSDFVEGVVATHLVSKQGDYTHDGAWHHYVFIWTNGSQILYVDGVSAATASFAISPFYGSGTGKTRIGAEAANSTPTSTAFSGGIDEVRISSSIRSADWVAACYANQSDPSTFLTIGDEESTDPRTAPIIDWSDPADLTYPDSTMTSTQLDAVEHNGVAGTFFYYIGPDADSGFPIDGVQLPAVTNVAINVLFTPTDDTTYKPVTKTVHITILHGATSLTFSDPTPADIDNPTPLSTDQLNASEDHSIAGTIVYTIDDTVVDVGTVLAADTYTILATFTPDDESYETATASVSLTVNPNPTPPSTPTFVQGVAHTSSASSPMSVTFDADVQVGSTIICVIGHNYRGCDPGPSAASDSLGNSYTRSGTGQGPSSGAPQFLWIYTAPVTTAGPCTVTITYACGGCRWAFFTEWTGIAADPYDGSNVATSITNATTAGSVTTTADGDLVLSAWSGDASSAWTAGSGTIILTSPDGPDAFQWQIADTAGAVAPTATGTGIGATYKGYGFTVAFKAAPAPTHDYTQDLADSVSFAEALIRGTGKHTVDSISLAELIHRTVSTARAESLTVTELLHRGTRKPFLESVAASDSLTRAASTAKADAIPVSDFVTKASSRSILDSFSISEMFASMKGKLVTLMDSVGLSDSIVRATDKAIVETLVLSERFTRAASRAYTDTLSVTDSIARRTSKAYTDSVTFLDSISRAAGKKLADTFNLSEQFTALYVLLIHLSDTLAISDSISKATSRAYTDAVSITDTIRRATSRAFAEIVSFLDLISTFKSRGVAFVDSLTLADTLGGRAINKALREALSLVETISKATSRTFADAITLVEAFTATFHRFVAAVRQFAAEILQRRWPSDYRVRLWIADKQPQRTFTFSGVETMIHTTADQDAIEDYEIDFSFAIGEDPIQAAAWTAATGITLGATSHTDTTTKARLSGGTLGKSYQVECAVTLLSSQVKVQRLQILISPNGDFETQ